MGIKEVRENLIRNLEDEYTKENIKFIDTRLGEIQNAAHLSIEDLDYYCTANSSEMFSCIFDYKEFDKNNFKVD